MNLIGAKGKYLNEKCEVIDYVENDIITIKLGDQRKVLDYITAFENKSLILDDTSLLKAVLLGIDRFKDAEKEDEKFSAIIDEHSLHYPNVYGTSAYDIYCRFCDQLEFKYEFKDNFRPRQILFAEEASQLGEYDIWFIAHSNWNSSRSEKWENYVQPNGDYIIEKFLLSKQKYEKEGTPKRPRLVFITQSTWEYMFLGIYEFDRKDDEKQERKYIRVEKDYYQSLI